MTRFFFFTFFYTLYSGQLSEEFAPTPAASAAQLRPAQDHDYHEESRGVPRAATAAPRGRAQHRLLNWNIVIVSFDKYIMKNPFYIFLERE